MIEFRNISLQIHHQPLLEHVSLKVSAGDKVVLCGASGSGKSSLLKCIIGAIPIAAGSVHLDGLVLSEETVGEVRSRIAFIGQEPILGAAKVREALLMPFTFKVHRHLQPEQTDIEDLLARLHLPSGILEKACAKISGGEKQRIAIARALLLNKTIFLADEITSALDPESRAAVMKELFRPEITLLSVSHDAEWIEGCARTVNIVDRKLVEEMP